MPTPGNIARRLHRDAWIVLGGDALSAVGSGMTLPFFLVYLSRIRGLDLATAGLALSTVALAGMIGNPVGGILTDRLGPRRALTQGLVVAAAGAFLVTLVRAPWHAFAAAAVVGLGAGTVVPAQDSLLAVVVEKQDRSAVFAVRNATLNAGYGLGAAVAALIADLGSASSFVSLYLIDGLTFLAFIPILWVVLPHAGPPSHEVGGRGYGPVLRDRNFVRIWLLIALLVAIGFSQTQAGFPAFATSSGGVSASVLSIAFAANTFTVLIAQLPDLRLMSGRRRTTGIVVAVACWATAWAMTLVAGSIGSLAVAGFVAAMVVFAIGETFLAPSQAALINDLAPDDLRGRYNGLYTLAWTVGNMIGPALAGAALGAGRGNELFGGLIVACGLAAVAAMRVARRLPADIDVVD